MMMVNGDLCEYGVKVFVLRSTAFFRQQLHQLTVRPVAHTQQRHHLQSVQFRFVATLKPINNPLSKFIRLIII